MKVRISKHILLMSIACLALVVAVGAAALTHKNNAADASKPPTHTKAAQTKTPQPVTKDSTQPQPTASNTAKATHATTSSSTPACKLFTLAVAQQVLGSTAQSSTPSDMSSLNTSDTSVSACAYAASTPTAQLTVRTPKNSLGTSENATNFGSGKPSNATTLQGYGQAAYWDTAKLQLNVLGHNNWYIITTSANTQAGAEALAKQLATGF